MNKSTYQRNLEKLERDLAALHKPNEHYDAAGNLQRVKDQQKPNKDE
jgi:hypothetical protein